MPCLAVVDVHALCQAIGGDAIDDAEVGLLGLLALLGRHGIYGHVPYLGGSGCVDVMAYPEGLDHVVVARQVCHNTQFYLRIVC